MSERAQPSEEFLYPSETYLVRMGAEGAVGNLEAQVLINEVMPLTEKLDPFPLAERTRLVLID